MAGGATPLQPPLPLVRLSLLVQPRLLATAVQLGSVGLGQEGGHVHPTRPHAAHEQAAGVPVHNRQQKVCVSVCKFGECVCACVCVCV